MTRAYLTVLSDDPLGKSHSNLVHLVLTISHFLLKRRRRHQKDFEQIFQVVFVLGKLELTVSLLSQLLENVDGCRKADYTAADLVLFQAGNGLENVAWVRICQRRKHTQHFFTCIARDRSKVFTG